MVIKIGLHGIAYLCLCIAEDELFCELNRPSTMIFSILSKENANAAKRKVLVPVFRGLSEGYTLSLPPIHVTLRFLRRVET